MKKLCLFALSTLLTMSAWADISLEPLLNKVTLQLSSEQWVTTKTALVDVGINAAVADKGIEKIQNEALQKLAQLSSKGDWHIVSYNRALDKSGLESIQMIGQARLDQSELGNLRDKAKSISVPGETFTIDNVQFIPSEDELKQANILLRNNIYQQAKAEIDSLNKAYPDQKYYLHSVDFINPIAYANNTMLMAKAAAPMPRAMAIGNKQILQANVVIASMPDQVLQKIAHQ